MRLIGRQKGFSLIELLIVVAIILAIAAIAIPNLMRARMAANDAAAAKSLHTIEVGEIGYSAAYPTVGFPATLAPLGGADPCTPSIADGCLIDNDLATNGEGNGKSGYQFNATGSASTGSAYNDEFYATATPTSDLTGTRAYCVADDGVVRLQPPGTVTLVQNYTACLALSPMQD